MLGYLEKKIKFFLFYTFLIENLLTQKNISSEKLRKLKTKIIKLAPLI